MEYIGAWIIMFLIYCISIFLLLAGDWIISKTKLCNCKPVMAEIICFEEIHFVKSGCNIAILHYNENGNSRDTFVVKAKNDRVGDKIEIITDGCLAVRKGVVLQGKISIMKDFIAVVAIFFLFKHIFLDKEMLSMLALLTVLILVLIITIFYPYFYEAYYNAIKQKLRWKN